MLRTPILLTALGGFFSATSDRAPINVSGTWIYDAPRLEIRSGTKSTMCRMRAVKLTFEQQDSVLTGRSAGGTLSCSGAPSRPVTEGPINGGMVRGDSIVFRIGPFVHRGKLSARTVRGTVTISERPNAGTFQMKRQR